MTGMQYPFVAMGDHQIPEATESRWQHAIDTYASETNKVASVWREFRGEHLDFRPHPRSSSVIQILTHQLLSERRFFGEFLGLREPAAAEVAPEERSVESFAARLVELALPRLAFLAAQPDSWWLGQTQFFDVRRARVWIFWRRVLHTAHHRTQLTVYLRLLDRAVVPTYGPTADVTWHGADPSLTVEAAELDVS